MFITYVINLNSSKDRLRRTLLELSNANVNRVERFVAIDGSKHTDHSNVTSLCKQICTKEMIGCALSHIAVANVFSRSNEDYCVVVEDDVRILNPSTFVSDVQRLYRVHKEKEVVRIFCQGLCYTKARFAGSTAAYILTRKGASVIKGMKVSYHIDLMLNHLNIHNEQLVSTYDDERVYANPFDNMKIMNQRVGFWGTQTIFQIPYTTVKVNFKKLILFVFLFLFIFTSVIVLCLLYYK